LLRVLPKKYQTLQSYTKVEIIVPSFSTVTFLLEWSITNISRTARVSAEQLLVIFARRSGDAKKEEVLCQFYPSNSTKLPHYDVCNVFELLNTSLSINSDIESIVVKSLT
jgi:hypothetical protein